jgi:F-type H+-transporting ATPase subunit delta
MVSLVARNYARAIFELAREAGRIDAIGADLPGARDALTGDAEIRGFLASRLIGRQAKKSVIRKVLSDTVEGWVLTLIVLLVDRGRIRILPEIAEEYERLARYERGEREVILWTAFPLGEEERQRITRAMEARFGGHVRLDVREKPGLIGGVVAESEGQEIDFTLEGQLKGLAGRIRAGRG